MNNCFKQHIGSTSLTVVLARPITHTHKHTLDIQNKDCVGDFHSTFSKQKIQKKKKQKEIGEKQKSTTYARRGNKSFKQS